MAYKNYVKTFLKLIAGITIVSGMVQLIKPAFVLGMIGGLVNPTTEHFFGIVGLFMVLFGALLFHSLIGEKRNSAAVLWCGMQKFGAAGAVTLGVTRDIFSWLALGVAGFDLLSGVLIIMYWFSIQRR
jgi:hypothetical protein